MRKATRSKVLSAALSLGLLAAMERPARADALADLAVAVVIGVIAADVTFFVYDIKVAAQARLPDRGWAIAETVVAAPQTILANGAYIVLADKDTDAGVGPLVLIPAALTSMNVHGAWASATTNVRPNALFGYSPLIGINTSLTAAAVGRAVRGHWGSRSFGIVETVLTAPQVALGGVQMFHDPQNRNIWIAHTAWTTTLLLHGIASIAAGEVDAGPPPAPPPPPDPPPLQVPGEDTPERPPLKVPYSSLRPSFHVGPGVVTDGVARAPGLMVVGRF